MPLQAIIFSNSNNLQVFVWKIFDNSSWKAKDESYCLYSSLCSHKVCITAFPVGANYCKCDYNQHLQHYFKSCVEWPEIQLTHTRSQHKSLFFTFYDEMPESYLLIPHRNIHSPYESKENVKCTKCYRKPTERHCVPVRTHDTYLRGRTSQHS
jgi:hypothetical protein